MNESAQLMIFTSEDAHYSIYKMAALLGIGEKNVIAVKAGCRGINVEHLEQLIENYSKMPNCYPFMVIGTAGSLMSNRYFDTDFFQFYEVLILIFHCYFRNYCVGYI